jgi:hypothetical protein
MNQAERALNTYIEQAKGRHSATLEARALEANKREVAERAWLAERLQVLIEKTGDLIPAPLRPFAVINDRPYYPFDDPHSEGWLPDNIWIEAPRLVGIGVQFTDEYQIRSISIWDYGHVHTLNFDEAVTIASERWLWERAHAVEQERATSERAPSVAEQLEQLLRQIARDERETYAEY